MAVLTKDYDALGGGRRERCLPSLEAPALAREAWALRASWRPLPGGPSETPGSARRAAMVVGRR